MCIFFMKVVSTGLFYYNWFGKENFHLKNPIVSMESNYNENECSGGSYGGKRKFF